MTQEQSSGGKGDYRSTADAPAPKPDEVMFSAAVRAEQACRGSREANARRAAAGRFAHALTADVIAFIGGRNSAYLATASVDGQPYVQHRGGPKGFIKVLDERTVAFPEYSGNRQYISTGHLSENDRAFPVALPNLTLPPFTIYTADAARLSELPLPAPRKIAYFYAQIASIQDDLTRLATGPVSESSAGSRTERIRCVLTELNDALALGDNILHELRPLLSPKHQKSLTRA